MPRLLVLATMVGVTWFELALSCDLTLVGMALLFGTENQAEELRALPEKRETKYPGE
jgi:hypothetical protein